MSKKKSLAEKIGATVFFSAAALAAFMISGMVAGSAQYFSGASGEEQRLIDILIEEGAGRTEATFFLEASHGCVILERPRSATFMWHRMGENRASGKDVQLSCAREAASSFSGLLEKVDAKRLAEILES